MIKEDLNYTASSFFIQPGIKNRPDEISDVLVRGCSILMYLINIKEKLKQDNAARTLRYILPCIAPSAQ